MVKVNKKKLYKFVGACLFEIGTYSFAGCFYRISETH